MPLTSFQIAVLRVIAANRSVNSHVAGGIALNSSPDSPRFSADIDIFHDAEEAVVRASEQDSASLSAAGYRVTPQLWQPAYRQAWVERENDGIKVEWAHDAAWRFLPVEQDPVLGWRLHSLDLLTNKALAMGSRSETRDLVDLVVHSRDFPLHAIIWAACGKDPGWTPLLLLEQMRRHARVDRAAITEMQARMTPEELKSQWLSLSEAAEMRVTAAAQSGIEVGLCFLDSAGHLAWHDAPHAIPHRATLGGVVPRLGGVHYPIQN